MTKLEKYREELEKARQKRKHWEEKVKELEAKYHEAEKTTVHDMVSSAEISPEQLAQLLRLAKSGEIYYGIMEEKYQEAIENEE